MIEVEDGFGNDDGSRNDAMPTMRVVFSFEETAAGTRSTIATRFASLEAMEQVAAMGMVEGLRSAMSQIDGVLADLATFAASRATDAQRADPHRGSWRHPDVARHHLPEQRAA